MTPIIEARRLTFTYPHAATPAVNDASLQLEKGSFTALLGANGAGKTTLLRLLLGMHTELNDHVLVDSQPLASMTRRQISRWLGYVPQSEHLPFDYSVLEYVLLGRAPHLEPLAMPGEDDLVAARSAIAEVGINHLLGRPIPELSGGELQLAMIARVVAQQSAIILLDEPTAHLDLVNKARMTALLQQLTARGVTVLASLHDPETAAQCASHVILMRLGAVVAAGPTNETITSTTLSAAYGAPVTARRLNGEWLIRVPPEGM